jgi:hypothetical protein
MSLYVVNSKENTVKKNTVWYESVLISYEKLKAYLDTKGIKLSYADYTRLLQQNMMMNNNVVCIDDGVEIRFNDIIDSDKLSQYELLLGVIKDSKEIESVLKIQYENYFKEQYVSDLEDANENEDEFDLDEFIHQYDDELCDKVLHYIVEQHGPMSYEYYKIAYPDTTKLLLIEILNVIINNSSWRHINLI